MAEIGRKKAEVVLIIEEIMFQSFVLLNLVLWYIRHHDRKTDSFEHFETMVDGSDDDTETSTSSVCQPRNCAPRKNTTGRKRKRESSDGVDPIYALLISSFQNTNARLGEIAKRIGYEYDISNARKKVFAVVDNIADLTLHEKVLVSMLLVKDDGVLELFFSLPDDVKVEFVKMKLAGRL